METYIVKKDNDELFLFKEDKKIGQISSEAKWVKEGDEFEEDQIRIDMIDKKFPAESHYDIEDLELTNAIFIKNRPDRFYISIAVKCPCCETFK